MNLENIEELVTRLAELYVSKLRFFARLRREGRQYYVLYINVPLLIWLEGDKLIESSVVTSTSTGFGVGFIVDEYSDTLLRVVLSNRVIMDREKPRCIIIITNIREKVAQTIQEVTKGQVKCEEIEENILKCCVDHGS